MTLSTLFFARKKFLFIFGIALSALLVGLYIFQLNYLTQLAYHIAETEEQLSELKYGNATLQAQTFQAISLKDMETLAAEKNFRKVDKVTYVQVSAGPVAQQ